MSVTLEVSKLSGWLNADAPENIAYMVVTLEVSQLDMSALKFLNSLKSSRMLVMAETSQSAIGPHFAVAAVGLALKARTSVIREALVVKTQAEIAGELGEGGGGLGEGGEGDGGSGGDEGGGGKGGGGGGDGGGGEGEGGDDEAEGGGDGGDGGG